MKTRKINAVLDVLGDISDQLAQILNTMAEDRTREAAPEAAATARTFSTVFPPTPDRYFVDILHDLPAPAEKVAERPRTPELDEAKRDALWAVLRVLNDWIETSFENHWANEHRGEPVGSECWTRFHPQDFRKMVNDAAREMGIDEIGIPVEPLEETIGR